MLQESVVTMNDNPQHSNTPALQRCGSALPSDAIFACSFTDALSHPH
jgi:hypothetical protein